MKINRISLTLAFLLLSTFCFSQIDSTQFNQAKKFYDNDDFNKAMNLLNQIIEKDSTIAEAFRIRGNCFFQFNQIENAISDYKTALRKGSTSSKLSYNLGSAYDELGMLDSAKFYFNRFIRLDSIDADGYLRLAIVQQKQGQYDSLRLLLEKSYALDTTNLTTIYYLTQECLIASEFDLAIKLCKSAKAIEPLDFGFYLFHGLANFQIHNFQGASEQADSALRLDPLSLDAFTLGIESKILEKSRKDKYVFNENQEYKFIDLNSRNFSDHLNELKASDYDSLFDKLNKGEILSLKGYINLYLLQSTQSNYSPYGVSPSPIISELYKQGKMNDLARLSDDVFKPNPLILDDILMVAEANYSIENMTEFKRLYLAYFGILESIIATGDGKSYDSAYVVMSTKDEYSLLYYLGLTFQMQSLDFDSGHSFDILTAKNQDNVEVKVYFNIDAPFISLGSTSNEKTRKRKKKKKN